MAVTPHPPPPLPVNVPLQELLRMHRTATAYYPAHQAEWDAWLVHTAEPLLAAHHASWQQHVIPDLIACIVRCCTAVQHGVSSAAYAPSSAPPQRAVLDALRLAATLLHTHKHQVDHAARNAMLATAAQLAKPQPNQQGFSEQQIQALAVVHAAAAPSSGTGHQGRLMACGDAAVVLANVLDWCVGLRRRPLEQRPWSRLYCALLRSCASVFAELRGLPDTVSLPSITTSLCKFLTYGLPLTPTHTNTHRPTSHLLPPPPASPAPHPPPTTRRYIPPHMRRAQSDMEDASDGESSSGASEGEWGGGGNGDPLRGGRVRCAALQVLQALARCDSQGIRGVWPMFMPGGERGGLGEVLLHDPDPKARSLAATTLITLLEGPQQRAFMAIAATPDTKKQPPRGFTSLSEALGHTLDALHECLLQSLHTERSVQVQPPLLRALMALVLGSPYQRLTPGLLLSVVQAVAPMLYPTPTTTTTPAAAAGALAVLAAAFMHKHTCPHVAHWLQAMSPDVQLLVHALVCGGHDPHDHAVCRTHVDGGITSTAHTAHNSTFDATNQTSATITMSSNTANTTNSNTTANTTRPSWYTVPERLTALRGVVKHAPMVVKSYWNTCLRQACALVERDSAPPSAASTPRAAGHHTSSNSNGVMEHCAQQSVLLLMEMLSHTGRQTGSQTNSQTGTSSSPSPSSAPSSRWQQLSDLVLTHVLPHPSCLVRCAGCMALGGMPLDILNRAMCLGLLHAAGSDEEAAGRSAALKALGVLCAAAGSGGGGGGGGEQGTSEHGAGEHGAGEQGTIMQQVPDTTAVPAVKEGALGRTTTTTSTNSIPTTTTTTTAAAAACVLPVVDIAHVTLIGLRDRSLSVRVVAAWTAANVCDVLQQRQQQQLLGGGGGTTGGGTGGGGEGDTPHEGHKGGTQGMGRAGWHALLEDVCLALLEAGQSSDKIAHNAVRGMGHALVAYVHGGQTEPGQTSQTSHGQTWSNQTAEHQPAWAIQGLEFIVCSIETGNSKVQWNCCYALGSLFALQQAWRSCLCAGLIRGRGALVALLQAPSTPPKVTGHAADALRRVPDDQWLRDGPPAVLLAKEPTRKEL